MSFKTLSYYQINKFKNARDKNRQQYYSSTS